jgi:hypothetical protein
MGLFERFINPVWRRVSALDNEHKLVAAFVISGYGALREALKDNLLEPLWKSGLVSQGSVNVDARERLIDEAAVGLMKSLDIPESDPNGNIPSRVLPTLPQIWGCFALADRNNRLKCSVPEFLEDSQYSTDTEEARTQVLVEWSKILNSTKPEFIQEANRRWFFKAWAEMSAVYMRGVLKGFGRIPNEVLMKKARSVSQAIPSHRISKALSFIESLGKVPLAPEPARSVPPGVAVARREGGAQGNSSEQRLHGVSKHKNGKVDIRLSPEDGPLEVIIAMFVAMQPMIVHGRDAEIWNRWASSVTGKKIIQGNWTPEHIDAFVRGIERFSWDGDGSEQWMTKLVREKYPQVKGTRIDIQLPDEIRARFRDMLTKKK